MPKTTALLPLHALRVSFRLTCFARNRHTILALVACLAVPLAPVVALLAFAAVPGVIDGLEAVAGE